MLTLKSYFVGLRDTDFCIYEKIKLTIMWVSKCNMLSQYFLDINIISYTGGYYNQKMSQSNLLLLNKTLKSTMKHLLYT